MKKNTTFQTKWFLCEHKESSLNMVINLMSIIRASDKYAQHKSNKKWAYMGNATKHTCVCGAAILVVFFLLLSKFQLSIRPIQRYRFRGQTHHAFVSSVHLFRFTDPIVCADQQTTNENQSFVLLLQSITEKHYLNATRSLARSISMAHSIYHQP